MNYLKFRFPGFAICLLTIATLQSGSLLAIQDETDAEDVFVRVNAKPSQSQVGVLVKEDAQQITINDMESGKDVSVPKTPDLEITRNLNLNDTVRYAGLTTVVGWKLNKLAAQKIPTGKIATVTSQVVYTTLGEEAGLTVGQLLSVYRNDGNIIHPDTGKVLGSQRSRIAQLEVVEVNSGLSKTKLKIDGNVEVKLEVGDEVEPASAGMTVAVCPIYQEDGSLTTVGAGIAEDLTTTLVQRDVSVVERSVIGQALGELLAQNTILFDEKSSQKIGKLTGANLVLSGKIVPKGNRGTVYVRLINVETGSILFAISNSVSLATARKIETPIPIIIPMAKTAVAQVTVFKMAGTKSWENSGILVSKGQAISISAPDDRVDRKKKKNYYGVNAYVGSLIARIDGHVIDIDQAKDFVAPGSGAIYFRQNLGVSPNHTVDITVTLKQDK